jgi:hypothetical protein
MIHVSYSYAHCNLHLTLTVPQSVCSHSHHQQWNCLIYHSHMPFCPAPESQYTSSIYLSVPYSHVKNSLQLHTSTSEQIIMVVNIKIVVFWEGTLHILVDRSQIM